MNAQLLLQSYGWLGPGHPLHPDAYKQKGHRGLAYDPSSAALAPSTLSNGSGLIRPLLISQKKGNLGVGKRAHEPQQGNEWWLKGFEKALGDVGKSESERSSGTNTPLRGDGGGGGKFGGLYSFFIKGAEMEGSIKEKQEMERGREGEEEGKRREKKKRKRESDVLVTHDIDSMGDEKGNTSNEQKDVETTPTFTTRSDKPINSRQKQTLHSAEDDFKSAKSCIEVRNDKPKKKRKSAPVEVIAEPVAASETKEERRERRRRRKEEKAAGRVIQIRTNGKIDGLDGDEDPATTKARRKDERKKRKLEAERRGIGGGGG